MFKKNTIRQRVMAVINAKIDKAEKLHDQKVKEIEAQAEADKKKAEDQLVAELTSFLK